MFLQSAQIADRSALKIVSKRCGKSPASESREQRAQQNAGIAIKGIFSASQIANVYAGFRDPV